MGKRILHIDGQQYPSVAQLLDRRGKSEFRLIEVHLTNKPIEESCPEGMKKMNLQKSTCIAVGVNMQPEYIVVP